LELQSPSLKAFDSGAAYHGSAPGGEEASVTGSGENSRGGEPGRGDSGGGKKIVDAEVTDRIDIEVGK